MEKVSNKVIKMKTILVVLFFSKAFADVPEYPPDEDIVLLNDSYSRIVGGQLAFAGQFPYQAGLYLFQSFTSNLASKCGGSLITQKWIVTAGHCTIGYDLKSLFSSNLDYTFQSSSG